MPALRWYGGEVTASTPPARVLPIGLRARLRLKHAARLGREVVRFSAEQRLWWLVPVVVLVLVMAMAVTTTTTVLPVAVYTLF